MAYIPQVLPVKNGGTGDVSFLANASITGGITSNAPLQNVVSAGNVGQVLTSNGPSNLPTYQTLPLPSSGSLVLIDNITLSGTTASFNFISGIAGFDVYFLSFYGVTVDTGATDILVQVSTNGGSSFQTTNYSTAGYFSTAGANGADASVLAGFNLTLNMSVSSVSPSSGTCYFYNFGNSSFNKVCQTISMELNSGNLLSFGNTSMWSTTTIVNALKFIMSAGNFLTGTFKLYGIKN